MLSEIISLLNLSEKLFLEAELFDLYQTLEPGAYQKQEQAD